VGHKRHGHGQHEVVQADPHARAEAAFSTVVADVLTRKTRASAFDRLVVVAAPHMLGSLRKDLGDEVGARVMAEVPKDLTQVPVPDIPGHLSDVLKF
jgi:protein required for attachment to host cells